jgi:hypothetical protein
MNFNGLILFDLQNNPTEFIIEASEQVIQIFNFNLINTSFGVKHIQNGFSIFDIKNNYIGHYESDSMDGYNYFDTNNNWIGFIK